MATLCDKKVFIMIYDEKNKELSEYSSEPKFTEMNFIEARIRCKDHHQYFTNDDRKALSNTSLTMKNYKNLF